MRIFPYDYGCRCFIVAEVEDVVDAVLWLLSDKASYINGITLPVEGGLLVA